MQHTVLCLQYPPTRALIYLILSIRSRQDSFHLPQPSQPLTFYSLHGKTAVGVGVYTSKPSAPSLAFPCMVSYISLGWLHSFFREVMADSTRADFLPARRLRAALEARKWLYRLFCRSVILQHTTSITCKTEHACQRSEGSGDRQSHTRSNMNVLGILYTGIASTKENL